MNLLSLGFSPCPNDTYIFCGLVNDLIGQPTPVFAEPFLEDVETLNLWAFEHRLDVTKLSFHAVGHLLDEYCILSAGSALGRGCGPLLVAAAGCQPADLAGRRVAIPGRYTTAALLFKLFMPEGVELVEMRFDRIMPAIVAGQVAAGVIIHESRFTYGTYGLVCLQDLGQWWEERSGRPIPLGCIAARRSLGRQRIAEIDRLIRTSLAFARTRPEQCADYIHRHAQETEEQVIKSHIGLYVNDFSVDLGTEGRAAVATLFDWGRRCRALPASEVSAFCCD